MTLNDPVFYLEIAELFLAEAALRDAPAEANQLLALGEHYLDLADEIGGPQRFAPVSQAA